MSGRDEETDEEPTRDEHDAEDSGMPEEEDDLAPMGVDEDDEDGDEHGTDAMPGIPSEDDPEISG